MYMDAICAIVHSYDPSPRIAIQNPPHRANGRHSNDHSMDTPSHKVCHIDRRYLLGAWPTRLAAGWPKQPHDAYEVPNVRYDIWFIMWTVRPFIVCYVSFVFHETRFKKAYIYDMGSYRSTNLRHRILSHFPPCQMCAYVV